MALNTFAIVGERVQFRDQGSTVRFNIRDNGLPNTHHDTCSY